MAPHGDVSGDIKKVEVAQSESHRPISTVVFVIAMQAEALLLTNKAWLSTGDSLDMYMQDESLIIANDATLKDMEGADVTSVPDLLKVPVGLLKAVTDQHSIPKIP